jgi:peptidoglycan/xylan/chitin deacetylase (PgdA/CDA1 family)
LLHKIKKVRKIPQKLWSMVVGKGGSVVNYHRVGSEDAFTSKLGITIPTTVFTDHIQYLATNFSVVPFSEFLKSRFKKDKVAITFDDGYLDIMTVAMPILKAHNCPFKIFLNSEQVQGKVGWLNKLSFILSSLKEADLEQFAAMALPSRQVKNPHLIEEYRQFFEFPETLKVIDKQFMVINADQQVPKMYLDQNDIQVLKSNPLIEWGSHSASHMPLGRLPHDIRLYDVLEGHKFLKTILEARLDGFALPFGHAGMEDEVLADLVAKVDDRIVTSINERVSYKRFGRLTAIQRVNGGVSLAQLKTKVESSPHST